jgi:hypothetical protein
LAASSVFHITGVLGDLGSSTSTLFVVVVLLLLDTKAIVVVAVKIGAEIPRANAEVPPKESTSETPDSRTRQCEAHCNYTMLVRHPTMAHLRMKGWEGWLGCGTRLDPQSPSHLLFCCWFEEF